MRVLICGSRGIDTHLGVIHDVLYLLGADVAVTHIISGGARGVDTLAERYATENGIPFTEYPAMWGRWGKWAGFVRNAEMIDACDAVAAVWDGKSPGTRHTIQLARKERKRTEVLRYDQRKQGELAL